MTQMPTKLFKYGRYIAVTCTCVLCTCLYHDHFFDKVRFDIFSDPPLTVSLTSNLTSSSHAEMTYAEVKCAKAECYPENPLLVLSQENSDDLVLTNDDTLYYPMKLDRKDNLLALSCCAGSDTVWDEVCSAKQLRPNVTCT